MGKNKNKKKRIDPYFKMRIYNINDVLDYVTYDNEGNCINDMPETKEYVGIDGATDEDDAFDVKMDSLRYRTFKHNGTSCSVCGIKATHFWLEINKIAFKNESYSIHHKPHFNLYATDDLGNEILMTKDHTLASALGGSDKVENLTTMCSVCNNKKSFKESHTLKKIKDKILEKESNNECHSSKEYDLMISWHRKVGTAKMISGNKCKINITNRDLMLKMLEKKITSISIKDKE